MGYKLYSKEVQLSIRKAATKAPTNIRNIVPGPKIVPPINIICKQIMYLVNKLPHTTANIHKHCSKTQKIVSFMKHNSSLIESILKKYLVCDIRTGDVIVNLDSVFTIGKQVHNVSDGGRHPATTLIVELVETFGTVSVGVGGS